jgi:hypothetical protein
VVQIKVDEKDKLPPLGEMVASKFPERRGTSSVHAAARLPAGTKVDYALAEFEKGLTHVY